MEPTSGAWLLGWEETNPSNIHEHLYMDIRKLLA
jgi:hypothetical protein